MAILYFIFHELISCAKINTYCLNKTFITKRIYWEFYNELNLLRKWSCLAFTACMLLRFPLLHRVIAESGVTGNTPFLQQYLSYDLFCSYKFHQKFLLDILLWCHKHWQLWSCLNCEAVCSPSRKLSSRDRERIWTKE